MAFLRMHPCPKCNSRDNVAEYSDGFYCFGCGWKKSKIKRLDEPKKVKMANSLTLDKNLPKNALKWLLSYNLTQDELQQFYFTEKYGYKMLVLYVNENYWVARNLDEGQKYFSSGEKPYIEYGNKTQKSDILVFVEDIISAIKVGRQYVAVPMLGSKPKNDWLTHLKKYETIIIWGDRDKATDNIKLCRRLRETLGKNIEVIITDLDPKEYSDKEIKEFVDKVL